MSSSPTLANGSSKTRVAAESPEHPIIQMALRDVSVLFRTPWIIITRALAFIVQLFVFANLISGLIHIPGLNYYEYYAVGSVVATIASISFVIGYDIFEEAEEGVLDYLLTLPISRRQFIIGRALGGAMRAIIYTIPMFVIVAIVWRFNQPLSILTSLLSLFLLAFGVTDMSITVAVSVKSANRFDVEDNVESVGTLYTNSHGYRHIGYAEGKKEEGQERCENRERLIESPNNSDDNKHRYRVDYGSHRSTKSSSNNELAS